jgi:hypothetical protein
MGYTPVGSNEAKIDAARRALHLATSKYPLTRIVGFSGRGVDSFSRDTLYKMLASGGTPLLKALQFAHQQSPKRVILISDGQPTDASVIDIVKWVVNFVSFPIDTVATDDADDDFLRCLSEHTGGEFKRIDDLSGMLEQHVTYLIEERCEAP